MLTPTFEQFTKFLMALYTVGIVRMWEREDTARRKVYDLYVALQVADAALSLLPGPQPGDTVVMEPSQQPDVSCHEWNTKAFAVRQARNRFAQALPTIGLQARNPAGLDDMGLLQDFTEGL